MSRSKIGRNPKNASSIPGTKYLLPSGASELATINDPLILDYALRFGNRSTKRLAMKKITSSSYIKLLRKIESPK